MAVSTIATTTEALAINQKLNLWKRHSYTSTFLLSGKLNSGIDMGEQSPILEGSLKAPNI